MSGRKSHAFPSCIRKKKKCLCGTNQNRTPRTNQNRTPRTAVRPKRARHNGGKYTPTTILRDHASFFFNTNDMCAICGHIRDCERIGGFGREKGQYFWIRVFLWL